MLPFAPVAALLIELDHRTGFLGCFAHAGGRKQARSTETKRNILAVLIARATNLGLTQMSESCGVSCDVLAWTEEWYVREETLRDANRVLVNYHHALPLSQAFGGGTMSSSDGQRFPVRGKSATARHMNIFGGRVLSTYTHVSDQWSTYGTRVMVPIWREAHFVLDEILGNATDLPITEHATDTHGVNNGELRRVRPGRPAAVAAHPRPGKDHPVPGRHPAEHGSPLPARRTTTDRPAGRGPDRLLLG
jgi:hypothetical protein